MYAWMTRFHAAHNVCVSCFQRSDVSVKLSISYFHTRLERVIKTTESEWPNVYWLRDNMKNAVREPNKVFASKSFSTYYCHYHYSYCNTTAEHPRRERARSHTHCTYKIDYANEEASEKKEV